MYDVERIYKNILARDGHIVDTGEDGGRAVIQFRTTLLRMQFSWGLGWEHVSVSNPQRCPTWDEMCFVKDIFWPDDECCVQYHPARKDYVNIHKYCLHIFRPIDADFPKPPLGMI